MAKSLVIVESPAKVKSINKFLGPDFIVKSSIGHIRDLPKSSGSATTKPEKPKGSKNVKSFYSVSRMGIDPQGGWNAQYEILPGKEKVLKQLQDAAKDVSTIYLATDLDREGEAIAWHLREAIGGPKEKYKRVTFTEITKKAVLEAFKHPGELNINRVQAQQARRFLDRVVGYMVSPLLWEKVARGLSAGRVQSVAVRLISDREREIHAFKTEEYWDVTAFLKGQTKDIFEAQVTKFKGQPFEPKTESQAMKAHDELKQAKFVVEKIEKKATKSKPQAPFITSTLQQAASVRLGFGVKKTITLAQQLYEAGYITYIRTDSTNLSKEAVEACRQYIEKEFGSNYLPKEPQEYVSKKSAQEAHEAIRPTDVHLKYPQDLDRDCSRLYEIIWRQFVSCQMAQAEFDTTSVSILAKDYELKARGRVVIFDGYQKVQPPIAVKKNAEELEVLPHLEEKESLNVKEILPAQHFTKPPPRFTEASLVRELEKKAIGRPSTYASIISTIQERGYVKIQNRRFFSLKLGDIVTNRLVENFSNLMDYQFTARMEEDLDKIAAGDLWWKITLDDFFKDFVATLEKATQTMRYNLPTEIDVSCPSCQRPMSIRTARTGVFLGCTGYSLPKEKKCTTTINLVSGDEVEAYTEDEDEGNVLEIQKKKRCSLCDTAMDSYLVNESCRIHVCGNNPECSGYEKELGKFRIKGYEGPVIQCDKCEADMQLKTGRFGKYFGCINPECKNTRKLLKNGEAAPPKADAIHMPELKCKKGSGYFVLRDGASGLFLASSEFPKSRETRKPLVIELLPYQDKLEPKYHHLAKAPTHDPKGNPVSVRFSRKKRAHFVASDEGWSSEFVDGQWTK